MMIASEARSETVPSFASEVLSWATSVMRLCPLAVVLKISGRLVRRDEPVVDALAGPEHHVLVGAHMLERFAEVTRAVWRAHDVGVHDKRHDAGRVGGIRIDLIELINRAIAVLGRGVMLDQHHGH